MHRIKISSAGSLLDFDHGEGWVTFSWVDPDAIRRSLTIDLDGHCSREMPIRSGSEPEIVAVTRDCVQLRFRPELAAKLELPPDVQFCGNFPDEVVADLIRLMEYF